METFVNKPVIIGFFETHPKQKIQLKLAYHSQTDKKTKCMSKWSPIVFTDRSLGLLNFSYLAVSSLLIYPRNYQHLHNTSMVQKLRQ